jgi:hypothetical protein
MVKPWVKSSIRKFLFLLTGSMGFARKYIRKMRKINAVGSVKL